MLATSLAGADAIGPTRSEFVEIIRDQGGLTADVRPDTIRLAGCKPFDEEPTELHCDFRAQTNRGVWRKRTAIVTYDKGWMLIGLE